MGRVTRSTTTSPSKTLRPNIADSPQKTHDPVKVLIIPRSIRDDARILTLKHSANEPRKLFVFCTANGLFEIKKSGSAAPNPRSIMFVPAEQSISTQALVPSPIARLPDHGYINKDAETLIATPYDIIFLLIRLTAPQKVAEKSLFRPLDDILESADVDDESIQFILKNGQEILRHGMSRICATTQVGDETMFRYDEDKLLNLILEKAGRVVELGLPRSLEDHFVTRALEAPMLSIKRDDSTMQNLIASETATPDALSTEDTFDSQASSASTVVSVGSSEAMSFSTATTLVDNAVPNAIVDLQRIRTAFNFITASYLPPYVVQRLTARFSQDKSLVDFEPLDVYLKNLAVLKAEAAASRSMTDFSRKRGLDDDEAAEERAEKKQKQEEEEKKRKANESRGVRELKKVNVTGMKKMSDFFSKKPATAKTKG